MKRLGDQVDPVQPPAQQPKRPWYRQFSNVASGIALVVSLVGALYGYRSYSAEVVRSKKEELRGAIAQLLALREEILDRVASTGEPKKRDAARQMLNAKRMVYLEAAESLASQIGEHVSSSEYNVLANEVAMDARFEQAETYFAKAVGASHAGVGRAVALRTLAIFYFGPGPLRAFDKGRRHFQEAVDQLIGASDNYSLLALGNTYEAWGYFEQRNGSEREASQKFEMARKKYAEMAPDSLRDQALDHLQRRPSLPAPSAGQ